MHPGRCCTSARSLPGPHKNNAMAVRDRAIFPESLHPELSQKLTTLLLCPGFGRFTVITYASDILRRHRRLSRGVAAPAPAAPAAAVAPAGAVGGIDAAGEAEDGDIRNDALVHASAEELERAALEAIAALGPAPVADPEADEVMDLMDNWVPSNSWCYWFLKDVMGLTSRRGRSDAAPQAAVRRTGPAQTLTSYRWR